MSPVSCAPSASSPTSKFQTRASLRPAPTAPIVDRCPCRSLCPVTTIIQGGEVMSADANRAVVRRFFEELWNGGDLTVADEIIAPDFVPHDPGNPWLKPGPGGTKELVSAYRAAFPDVHFAIDD